MKHVPARARWHDGPGPIREPSRDRPETTVPDPYDDERLRLGTRGRRPGPGLLTRIVAVISGALLLVGAIAISIVAFAVVAAVIIVGGLYLWWKTRDLRKQMRARMEEQLSTRAPSREQPRGNVIEGEFTRKDDPPRS
jgi:Flp pilus assembly protein TadB